MYGVDQCRVCGTPIVVRSPETLAEQEKAIRRPVVPEKVWRARGYLTVPTPTQWRVNPSDGCCRPCGEREFRKRYQHVARFWIVLTGVIVVAVIIVTVVRYLPH